VKKLRRKSEVVEKCIEPAVEFFKKMNKEDRVVVIHDDDCDGICSGSILALMVRKLGKLNGIISTEYNLPLTENVVKEALSLQPNKIIISDVPEVDLGLLNKLRKFEIKTLIVDHHKPISYPVSYCNPRVFDKDIYIPASYLAYRIHKHFFEDNKVLWIACVGVLADRGVENCKDVFLKLKEVYPELVGKTKLSESSLFRYSLLGKLVKVIDAAQVVKGKVGAEFVSRILIDIESYTELLNGGGKCKRILCWYKTVEKEFNRILEDFQNNRVLIGNGFVFYEIDTKLRMKSRIAGYLSNLYRKRILIVGQKIGDYFEFSVRRGREVKIDLGKFVKKLINGIDGASGGGHPEAAAGRVPYKHLNLLLGRLKT